MRQGVVSALGKLGKRESVSPLIDQFEAEEDAAAQNSLFLFIKGYEPTTANLAAEQIEPDGGVAFDDNVHRHDHR